jgi:diadenosine tetraphosphate (Ap4A) HIT family hydrolase
VAIAPEAKRMTLPCPLCTPHNESLIWSDEQLRVIAVNDPDFPGFMRVICQQHVREFSDLSPAQRIRLMELVAQIESVMREMLSPEKINLASLGNQVPHLHWHIIPRWSDDPCFPDSIWSTKKRLPAASARNERQQLADRFVQQLRQQLSNF